MFSIGALDACREVTVYVRNPAKLDGTKSDLAVIDGALTDADAIDRTIPGKEAGTGSWGP